jgi:hypothetical protein
MTANPIRRGALALSAATFLAMLAPSSADAQYYPRRHGAGEAVAGGVVGGLLGGLAAGAIINSTRPHYYPPVAEPAPVYAAPPEPVYVPTCHIVRRKVWLDDYAYTFRRERVCE